MTQRALRADLAIQLDLLIHACLIESYLLDGLTLNLLLRAVTQVQFLHPRQMQPQRSLRFFTLCALAFMITAMIGHATAQFTGSSRGLFVDFIGTAARPSKIFLIAVDLLVCACQMLLALIAWGDTHDVSRWSSDGDGQDKGNTRPLFDLQPGEAFTYLTSTESPERGTGSGSATLPQTEGQAGPMATLIRHVRARMGGRELEDRAGPTASDLRREEEDVGG